MFNVQEYTLAGLWEMGELSKECDKDFEIEFYTMTDSLFYTVIVV